MVLTLFLEIFGIILALGTIMVLFVMVNMARKSDELAEIIIKFGEGLKWLKPMMWFGIIVTGLVWAYFMYYMPYNPLGIINSLVLIIAIISTFIMSSRISKMEYGRIPIISSTIWVLIWWVFVYLTIQVLSPNYCSIQ